MFALRNSDGDVLDVVRAKKGGAAVAMAEAKERGLEVETAVWAELLLGKAALALAVNRLKAEGKFNPESRVHKAVLVRAAGAVLGKHMPKETAYATVNGTLKDGGRANRRWSFNLNGHHRQFTDRICRYYEVAMTPKAEPVQ